jgi:4'-phosphopantetheinyl transferase
LKLLEIKFDVLRDRGKDRLLQTDEIHLWWGTAEDFADERWMDLLSGEERRRHAAYRFERDRAHYLAAHALTRTALSHYADVEARAWRFVAGYAGKPAIANELDRAIGFSLSHADGLVACAIAAECDVGLDVENIGRTIGAAEMRFVLAPAERRQIETGEASFFDFWTLKEAYLKAKGVGLMEALDQTCFRIDGDRVEFQEAGWSFFRSRPTPRHQMAVAAKSISMLSTR